jgi:hypothetical protein
MVNVEKEVLSSMETIRSPPVLLELVPRYCHYSDFVAIKVYPGEFNKGIFITLKHRDNEEYQLTHPSANVTGFISLKLHPYVTVQDYCVITCPKTKVKALLRYVDEVPPPSQTLINP